MITKKIKDVLELVDKAMNIITLFLIIVMLVGYVFLHYLPGCHCAF